ncbi:MAG: oligosaccharide flippase family protein [Smithellaceae bacterium]|jgi:O-antigen/teichoic acid export membrane protein
MEKGPKQQSLLDYLKLKLSHKRTKEAFIGSVSIVLSKFLALTLGLITTAILVRHVSAEEFGLWGSLTFLIGMIPVLDLGLGLSLRNKLAIFYSEYESHANECRRYFFSAYYAYLLLAGFIVILLCLCYRIVPWAQLFNTNDTQIIREGSLSYVISLIILVIGLPCSISIQGFFSFQQTQWNSFFELLKSILVLLFMVTLILAKVGFVLIMCSFALGMTLPVFISFFVFLKKRQWRPGPINIRDIAVNVGELLPQGIQFGILQFCSTLVFSSQALIVGKLIGLKDAGEYALVQKLFLILTIIHFAVLTPLWSAYTDAVASNDIRWARKTLTYSGWFSVILFSLGSAFFYFFGRTAIFIWTGKTIVNHWLYIWMGIWIFLSGIVNCFSVYLNGIGRLRMQTVLFILAALTYVPLALFLGNRFGTVGVCMGGAIAILPLAVANPLQAIMSFKEFNGRTATESLNSMLQANNT